jgi:hypothetical protein
VLLSFTGCSFSSLGTSEALLGGGLGAAAGTGAGYAIGESIGKSTENMLLVGGIGTGLGLLGGAMLHERNMKEAQRRDVLIREIRMVGENQKEIDSLRERMHDESSWGGMEVKPWNERYLGESYNTPYEGRISH